MTQENNTSVWSQREIVVVAALGVTFAIFYLGWTQLWIAANAFLAPVTLDILFGFWCVVSVVAAYVVRKPFAAFASELIAAVAEVLTGNPAGLILVLTGVVQGAGAELPFALTRWRNYSLPVLLAAGASAAVFSFVYTWIRFSYGNLSPTLLIVMFVLRIASGMILAGLLGKWIGDRLRRTGVLSGLAIENEPLAPGASAVR
jgi:energy-coupling factor transport system substrate-specific component